MNKTRQDGLTLLEVVVAMCVFHRPHAHAIATLLVDQGAQCGFQVAARGGLLDRVMTMLEADPALLDSRDSHGRTALYRATCVYGKFPEGEAVADFLLSEGADLDFYSACTLGMQSSVEELLDACPSLAKERDPDGMTALLWAVRNRRKLHLSYRDGEDRHSERDVRPLALAFYGPVWLMIAWCELRQDFRSFRLDRIAELAVLDEAFQPEPGKTMQDFLRRDSE